jgi:hypothetical protein
MLVYNTLLFLYPPTLYLKGVVASVGGLKTPYISSRIFLFSFLLFYRLSSPPPLFSLPRRDVMEEEDDVVVVFFFFFVDLLPLPPFY